MKTRIEKHFCAFHSSFILHRFLSVSDLEPGELSRGGEEVIVDAADEGVEAFADGIDDVIHLVFGAFEDELDSAVGEVFDVTLDVVLLCDVLGGVTEADALDAAAEDVGFAVHLGWRLRGPSWDLTGSNIRKCREKRQVYFYWQREEGSHAEPQRPEGGQQMRSDSNQKKSI